MSECSSFCGISSKSPPCGGFGTCVLEGIPEKPVCHCKEGYVQEESQRNCISKAQGYPLFTDLITTSVTLTELTAPSTGSVFSETALNLFSYKTIRDNCGRQFYFNANFSFIMKPKSPGSGGNGLAFVISATKKTASNIGSGVGNAGMDNRSMAVEFDTWPDKEHKDPSASHVGVNLNGSPFSKETANTPTALNNGKMYFAWVEYIPEAESLKVYLADEFNARPVEPVLSMSLSLCNVLQPTQSLFAFYFGFVAASRLHAQKHTVATASIVTGYNVPPPLPVDRRTGLLVDYDTFNPQTTSPFTRYVSVNYASAQDDQDSWRIPTYSTWTIDPHWLPQDQGDCGGCWAYAVVASIEAAYAIARNTPKSFPSLSITSLYALMGMDGCTSGSPTIAFQTLAVKATEDKDGLTAEPTSPTTTTSRVTSRSYSFSSFFSSSSSASPSSPSSSLATLNSYLFLASSPATHHPSSLRTTSLTGSPPPQPDKYLVHGFERTAFKGYFGLMLAVGRQPVVVHIQASATSFTTYDGILKYEDKGCYTGNLDHVVLVTGYLIAGTDNTRPTMSAPFWKIRNSWGTRWGANGYMYMQITDGDGICGINVLPGIYPVIRFEEDPCMTKAYKLKSEPGSVMNPCGSYTCKTIKDTFNNNCTCKPPFVNVVNRDKSHTCAYVDACSGSTRNPCEVGSCINDEKGSYTCVCPPTHYLDYTVDGFQTCSRDWEIASKLLVNGNNWKCADVHSLFNLTIEEFIRNNKGIICSKPLQEKTLLNMTKENMTPCSAFYYTLPGDTCSIVETFLNIKKGSLARLNPNITCSSLSASRSLCIDNSVTNSLPVPSCLKTASIRDKEGCKSLVNNPSNKISMVELYRMNPGLVCNSPVKILSDGASGSVQVP
ncbi:unnamed protein product, partial [Closterium sp. Naga37s-1]